MSDIFEKAARQKLRFSTTKGLFSTEDLFDLSLESLDALAKGVNKAVKESTEESFIRKATTASTELTLKLDILKHIIEVKLQEKEDAAKRKEKAARLATLKDLLSEREMTDLKGLDKAALLKEIAELEG